MREDYLKVSSILCAAPGVGGYGLWGTAETKEGEKRRSGRRAGSSVNGVELKIERKGEITCGCEKESESFPWNCTYHPAHPKRRGQWRAKSLSRKEITVKGKNVQILFSLHFTNRVDCVRVGLVLAESDWEEAPVSLRHASRRLHH